MEEINLNELLSYYLNKLPIILLSTILMLLVGYFYTTEVKEPLYNGTTTIILVQKQEENTSAAVTQSELTINEKLVSTYSQIIKSRKVLDQVIDSLELNTTANKLANKITVTSVANTSIIKVSVSDPDKDLAPVIANELADVFKSEITKIYNLENISIIDRAIVEKAPYNINVKKQTLIFGLIGTVLSCGIIFVVYYFDNSIKNKKEIEENLHLPVLGEIPLSKRLTSNEKERRINIKDMKSDTSLSFDKVDEVKKEVKKTTTKKRTKKEGGEK